MISVGNIEIDRADATRAAAICQLHLALCTEERISGYPNSTDDWISTVEGSHYLDLRLSGDGVALVAVVSGTVIGYLLAGFRVLDDEKAAGLESMYVVPDYRRKGVGMALLMLFLQWFDESPVALASVAIALQNKGRTEGDRTLYIKGPVPFSSARKY